MKRAPGEPRPETGFLVLVRQQQSGSWIVYTHAELRCPCMFISREQAARIAGAICGQGVADMALVMEILTPVKREKMASDWAEVSEQSRERSRQEIAAQRQSPPPDLVGYIVCGPYAEEDLWGISTLSGEPWIFDTETEAETLRAELESEGRHAVVYTVISRGRPTEVRGISQ